MTVVDKTNDYGKLVQVENFKESYIKTRFSSGSFLLEDQMIWKLGLTSQGR